MKTIRLTPLILGAIVAVSSAQTLTVGMEGRVQVHLPGTLLNAKPVDDKAPMIVRVASATVGPNGGHYDLRYIGLEPGKYDLREYLVRADGSALGAIDPIAVTVSPLLPENHNGELSKTPASRWPFFGGYRGVLIGVVALWVVLMIPIMVAGRKQKRSQTGKAHIRPETLADRLRPFIERAVKGALSAQEKSVLERLLLTHWQRRLGLTEVNPSEAIVALRGDPMAGELLRTLENWLHRPPGAEAAQVDVAALLKPYEDVQDPLEPVAIGEGGRA